MCQSDSKSPEERDLLFEQALLIDTRWIEPVVSEKAVAGYDEKLRPVLARKPLEQAENNYADAFDL